jgi:hypothetical protein
VKRQRLRVALALAFVSALGCDARSTEESQRQRDVAQLCWAENRVRNAPNAGKASLLAELSRAPCPAPDACRMRDACVAAYTLHVEALELTAAAKQLLSDHRDAEAAGILGAAGEKLKKAGPAVEECTALSGELRRAYAVR